MGALGAQGSRRNDRQDASVADGEKVELNADAERADYLSGERTPLV